ncbi:hypothetical protein A3A09_01105 [Candidatus Nomurabacteria bacterium RIFCSPLOWO2_01_FULL_42_20]|uniref:Uncharacterized protein n=1 Tax=Candidatus Nomurabacteria bacterium RIFCSPHIGHO2_01_FULL_42_16 TaxID=1801743 RepID=A0A1F6VLG8_9BACT|nr:MAG: hypothetical protein A2824_00120 [Candidatus Nomurabacteria bacterium RIFCSPHIGHO2_01_FULL_42_16]OGI91777.1 MAG: hypothetical protein A3A09_01105 [Candidatus Nomurabacteria bacterium RIFCSPLOWO2_01_FULL_42_20]
MAFYFDERGARGRVISHTASESKSNQSNLYFDERGARGPPQAEHSVRAKSKYETKCSYFV